MFAASERATARNPIAKIHAPYCTLLQLVAKRKKQETTRSKKNDMETNQTALLPTSSLGEFTSQKHFPEAIGIPNFDKTSKTSFCFSSPAR